MISEQLNIGIDIGIFVILIINAIYLLKNNKKLKNIVKHFVVLDNK